jgi:hypothetical protein
MNKTKQKLPQWFNGVLYTKGDSVTNPFSGDSIDLTAEELSMYDFVIGAQYMLEIKGYDEKIIKDMSKAISWFKINNSKAYMVLLD